MTNRLALRVATLLLTLGLTAAAVSAADQGAVMIKSPEDGATLDAMAPTELVYDVIPGPRGDHVHAYVDDAEVGILRQLTGSYPLPTLGVGEREICVRVVNRAHVPVGIDGCVKVTVQ